MLKKLLSLSLIFILLFTLCSCGGIKGADAALVYPIDKDPGYLDPQIIYDIGARNIIANCFEGLVALDSEGKIIPASAESWETDASEKVYTFHLRKDLQWKVTSAAGAVIGENYKDTFDMRVTAQDFAFGIKRALLPETKCPDVKSLFSIKNAEKVYKGKLPANKLGIKALDDYTLQITLSSPDPDFLHTLLKSCCMPCNEEFFEKTGGRYGLATRYLIFNGPFYINNWADDASVSVRKNDAYYDTASVMPRSVYYSINNEQPTRLRKLTDETYSVSPLTKAQGEEIKDKKNYTLYSFSSSVLSLIFNCEDENLKNLNIRRGIVASFNHSVLEDITGSEKAVGLIPDALLTGSVNFGEYRKTAEEYISASPLTLFRNGLNELEKRTIDLTIICDEEYETAVRTLMQSWQSVLGVAMNIYVEPLDSVTLRERVAKKNYQLAFAPITFTGSSVFSALEAFTSDSKMSFTGYSNKHYDSLVKKMKTSEGISTLAASAKDAEQHLLLNCVVLPLYKEEYYCGLGEKVTNVIFNQTGEILYFKYTLAE